MKIKEYRVSKGYTQKELSELLNIKQNTLCQYETGKREPNLFIIIKISLLLEVDLYELIEFEKIKKGIIL